MAATRPTIDEIVGAFHRGTRRAHRLYYDWTGGKWLNTAPEYLLTTYVAESIGKLNGSHCVSLEYSASLTIAEAGARKRGELPGKMRPDGRVDLLIRNGRRAPRGVIEIKNGNSRFNGLKKDVKRIESMLERASTLKFGAIGLYRHLRTKPNSPARDRVSTTLENLSTAFEEQTSDSVNWEPFPSRVHGDKNDAWASFIAIARP